MFESNRGTFEHPAYKNMSFGVVNKNRALCVCHFMTRASADVFVCILKGAQCLHTKIKFEQKRKYWRKLLCSSVCVLLASILR